ncbi:MAG: biotin--[Lachnospiraceae bacterium]|nr:biotin--[acetyl-CoA-carboxylase] ligase [Lachnospiraceae bacterium]
MKEQILTALRENNDYVSGQTLCDTYGVSRTAVWKAVNSLRNEGYEIDSVQNRGYKLINSPEIYSAGEIEKNLHTDWINRPVIFYPETGSTNIDCKKLLEEGKNAPLLVAAANQNAGKGRRGRGWESPRDTSISFSLGLKPDIEPIKAPMLTLVMAVAVRDAIAEITGLQAQIKWPNDIVISGKKVCGILTEMNLEETYISSVIIGVGINVGQTSFPEEIKDRATSICLERSWQMKKETDKEVSKKTTAAKSETKDKTADSGNITRSELTAACVDCFEKEYETFLQTLDLSGLKERYEQSMAGMNKPVRVLDPKGEFEGIARGITTDGQLLVERDDGKIDKVYAGEVSVRGIYGYID